MCHALDVTNQLSGKQRSDLRDALLAAFPMPTDIAEMFHIVFEEPLRNRVADGRPMNTVVFDLIDWAQRERKLDQLLDGALRQNRAIRTCTPRSRP
jgi:Effector-associated domain 1